jgi:hypothetical protein
MSMIGQYRRITLGQLYDLQDALRDNLEALSEYLYPESRSYNPPDPKLEIGKSWHGIHFLLCGRRYDGEPPLINVVMGGTEIGEEGGYGWARYLLPEQVKEVAAALNGIDRLSLRQQFVPTMYEAAKIYPGGWTVGESEQAFDWLWDNLLRVRAFFVDAAFFNDVILLYLT